MSQLSYLRQYTRPGQKDNPSIKTARMALLLLLMYLCVLIGINFPPFLNQLNSNFQESIDPRAILESAMPIMASAASSKGIPKKYYEYPLLDFLQSQLLCVISPRLILESQLPLLFSDPFLNETGKQIQMPLPDVNSSSPGGQCSSFPYTGEVNDTQVVFVGKDEYFPISPGYIGDKSINSVKKYIPLIKKYSAQYQLDPAIPLAIMQIESGGNPQAVSSKGALGIMQITQATAKEWGLMDPLNAEDNIITSIKILHYYYSIYNGNTALMAAAYNAGAQAVSKYNGVPDYNETKNYVKNFKVWFSYYEKNVKNKK